MWKNQVFANAFNYFVYRGEQKIHPEELVEMDTKEIEIPYKAYSTEKNPKAANVAEELITTTDSVVATDSMVVTDSKVATGSKILKNSKASKGAKTAKNSQKPVQKTRDVLKGIVAMKDRRSIYLIL